MKTKRQIKNFILKTLLPYKQDPSTCATTSNGLGCLYLTKDGRKCAVGKWLKKGEWQEATSYVSALDNDFGLENILLKEARDMNFDAQQWNLLQRYHDLLALTVNDSLNVVNNRVESIEAEFGIELPELKF